MAKDFIMNANKTDDGKQINWLKLKWLRVEKSDYESFLVKEELDDDLAFIRIPIKGVTGSRKSRRKAAVPEPQDTLDRVAMVPEPRAIYSSTLPISKAKLADLRKMAATGAILDSYKGFYEGLKERESSEPEDNNEGN